MGINSALAITLQSGQGSNMYGYDNEAGNLLIQLPLQAFPANSVQTPFSLAFTAANTQLVYLCSTTNCTIQTNGLNTADVQTISITGTPTGGSFPIAFNGALTEANYNTNASSLQTTLQALSTINTGNMNCSGGPLPGTPIICTFAGALNTGKQPLMLVGSLQLTGGSSPTASVAHTTPGTPTDTINLVAGIPRIWGASAGYGTNPFSANVNGAYMTCNASTLLNVGILTT